MLPFWSLSIDICETAQSKNSIAISFLWGNDRYWTEIDRCNSNISFFMLKISQKVRQCSRSTWPERGEEDPWETTWSWFWFRSSLLLLSSSSWENCLEQFDSLLRVNASSSKRSFNFPNNGAIFVFVIVCDGPIFLFLRTEEELAHSSNFLSTISWLWSSCKLPLSVHRENFPLNILLHLKVPPEPEKKGNVILENWTISFFYQKTDLDIFVVVFCSTKRTAERATTQWNFSLLVVYRRQSREWLFFSPYLSEKRFWSLKREKERTQITTIYKLRCVLMGKRMDCLGFQRGCRWKGIQRIKIDCVKGHLNTGQ